MSQQWHNDTLVAIKGLDNGKFKVIELPARQTSMVTSRRSFKTEEQAEAYIVDQYSYINALTVSMSDLELEQDNRKLHASRFQKKLDAMFFEGKII